MAEIRVNPTRMELLRLKRRLAVARRGHKLLKDKRDELMKRFLDVVRENRTRREAMETQLAAAHRGFVLARATMRPEAGSSCFTMPWPGPMPYQGFQLRSRTWSVMSRLGAQLRPSSSEWVMRT